MWREYLGTMDIQKVVAFLGILQVVHEFWNRFVAVNPRCSKLKKTLEALDSKAKDMKQQAENEENPGKKRKRVVEVYFKQVKRYKESANRGLKKVPEGSWKWKHMTWMPYIERHQRQGEELLRKGQELLQKGLTENEVRTHGGKLLLGNQYIGKTTSELMESALQAMKSDSARCIGIYGSGGAGKTNLMKYLYNNIYEDKRFKAVYWATAPEVEPHSRNYGKALQKCVADGMWIDDFKNYHSEATRAGRIMARLGEIGYGRTVLFLDNVREEFSAYELLGLPSLDRNTESDAASNVLNCILVFTTWSKDICNRMQCDLTLKMDLLNKKEAKEMFLHEVRHGKNPPRANSKQEKRIHKVAVKVANQCAGIPLVITTIAGIMAGNKDLPEWRNCLNELDGTITTIHENEEAEILEQLKFGYNCLKDRKVQLCFLEAADLLVNDHPVSKKKIIQEWKSNGLIGIDRQGQSIDDQGQTILNQLERMCLLQVAPDRVAVTMNKWIWKMAQRVKNLGN